MSDLSERIAAVLEHELRYGCTSTHDPRWAKRAAERVAELFTKEVLATQPGIWEQPSVHRWVSEWLPVEQRPEAWEQDWIRESW